MAVMAAFPLSLVIILPSVPFSINIDILDFFFQNYSYTVLALSFRGTLDMPRTKLSSAMSQDYLDFYYPSSAIPLLGLGLGPQYKNGPGLQIIGPHKYINFFFFATFKSRKLNNFILCVSIISTSSSFSSQKYYVSSLKDANNIDLMGKVT